MNPLASEAPGKGRQLYFLASIIGQAAALLRYVILARLLGPEQLGLAATLVVTAAFFDLVSDTGSDRFLIQDADGDKPQVQELVQLVYVVKGVIISLLMIAAALPVAAFYRQPPLALGFCFMAALPLIFGCLNLDMKRVQRDLNFRPEAIATIVGEISGLLATTAAAWATHNFKAILWGLTTRALVTVIVSHVTAERRYRLSWSSTYAPRLSRFSFPLMVTGLLLFIGSQGDRVVIADQLGVKAVGEYSATLLLIYSPSAIILRYMHNIYIPMVAATRADFKRSREVIEALGGQTIILGLAMAVGFAIVAPFMIPILFGARFAEPPLLVGLVGILQTTRFLINWPTTVALGTGRSGTVLFNNITRLAVFPGALIGFRLWGGLFGVVAGFTAGELLSIAVALFLLNRGEKRSFAAGFDRFGLFILTCVLILTWDAALGGASPVMYGVLTAASVAVAAIILVRERATLIEGFHIARDLAASWRKAIPLAQTPAVNTEREL